MGAMIIGMATGGFAMMCCTVIVNMIVAVIVFVDARRCKTKPLVWTFMSLLFGPAAVPFYLVVKWKISKRKCSRCGTKIDKDAVYCIQCGEKINNKI